MTESFQAFLSDISKICSQIKNQKEDDRLTSAIHYWVRVRADHFGVDAQLADKLRKESLDIVSRQNVSKYKILRDKQGFFGSYASDERLIVIALVALAIVNDMEIRFLKSSVSPTPVNLQKEHTPSPTDSEHKTSSPTIHQKPDNFILTVVVSENEKELLKTLRTGGRLNLETATQLFRIKQWVLYRSETEWKNNCQTWFDSSPELEPDEYDVHFIKLVLGEPDERLSQNSSLIKMSDAFKELGKKQVVVEVSPRHRKESYENKGFYRL